MTAKWCFKAENSRRKYSPGVPESQQIRVRAIDGLSRVTERWERGQASGKGKGNKERGRGRDSGGKVVW